ncbi:MAG: flagellar export chaperone FliS [Acidimicrobiia bacterium]
MALTARATYQQTSLQTMPKGRLLTMLYDRLLRDLHEASAAIEHSQPMKAHNALVHAQDIVTALKTALDTTIWPEGKKLDMLYQYLLEQLLAANLRKDASIVAICVRVVEPLCDAWHQAYKMVGSGSEVDLSGTVRG